MAEDPWAAFNPQPAPQAPPQTDPWAEFKPQAAPKDGVLMDVAKSYPSGIAKGVAETAGAIGWAERGLAKSGVRAVDTLRKAAGYEPLDPDIYRQIDQPAPQWARGFVPSSSVENIKEIESVTGPLHKPQTVAGEYARTLGEFTPGAVMGPSGAIPRTLSVVLPAVASETAGQLTKGSPMEPAARGIAALAAGGGQAYWSRPAAAEKSALASLNAIPEAERGVILGRAQELLDEAGRQGIPLSTANAIDAASNGVTNLSKLQRHIEGFDRMREFYAQMPEAVEQAGRRNFATFADAPIDPSMIGPRVGRAADQEIGATQAGINAETRPLYQQADPARLGDAHGLLMSDPLYAATFNEVRGNPALNRMVADLPDDAVGVAHLVSRRMGEQADNAAVPGQASSGNTIAANYREAQALPVAAAEAATGGAGGSFAQAQARQAQLRAERLEPLLHGPIGRLAGEPTTKRAIDALFPTNPLPNSAGEVQDAVGRLAARNPWAARQLVRAHAEGVFNEATQALQSGPNQMGGAKFAAVLRGNPQQAENLDAAIRALPNGDTIADGFNRFLEVLEAGGRRQGGGSLTAYNAPEIQALSSNGPIESGVKVALGGGFKWPEKITKRIEEWRRGRNFDELARLFSDPDAVGAFRGLLNDQVNPIGPTARLVAISMREPQARERR